MREGLVDRISSLSRSLVVGATAALGGQGAGLASMDQIFAPRLRLVRHACGGDTLETGPGRL